RALPLQALRLQVLRAIPAQLLSQARAQTESMFQALAPWTVPGQSRVMKDSLTRTVTTLTNRFRPSKTLVTVPPTATRIVPAADQQQVPWMCLVSAHSTAVAKLQVTQESPPSMSPTPTVISSDSLTPVLFH